MSMTLELKKSGKTLQTFSKIPFVITTPKTVGAYDLSLTTNRGNCSSVVTWTLNVRRQSFVVIGEQLDDIYAGLEKNIKRNDIALTHLTPNQITSPQSQILINNAQALFVDTNQYKTVFDVLSDRQTSKPIFIVSETEKTLLKKFLATFMKQSNIKQVGVLTNKEFFQILVDLSVGKILDSNQRIIQSLITFDWNRTQRSFGYVIDYLIYNWFPLESIKLFLVLTLCVLLIALRRQVIGFSAFGVYQPLIFALALAAVWRKLTLSLLGIGLIASVIVSLFVKKVNLLFSAKLWLLITVYIIVTLAAFSFLKSRGFIERFTIFDQQHFLVVYLFILIVSQKIFFEKINLMNKKRRFSLIQFGSLSLLLFAIVTSTWLQNLLLTYPEILILIVIWLLLLWRYTWLQLLEYVRFRPLIKIQLKK